MYYENFDLENVVTPVNVDCLEKLLIQSGYDKKKAAFLVKDSGTDFLWDTRGKRM